MPSILQTMRSGSGTLHPQEIMNFFGSFITASGGVRDRNDEDFKVVAQGTPDMTVLVKQGRALVPTANGKMAYPVHLYSEDYEATIGANGAGNPRIDAIVLYVDVAESPDPDIDNVAKIAVVAGTPSASPSAPDDTAIGTAIGGSNPYIVLAHVTVTSGATEIEDADILDTRDDAQLELRQPTIKGSRQEYVQLTDGSTITVDLTKGGKFYVTLGGNRSIVLADPPEGKSWAGKSFILRVVQDGTGNRSISSWFSGYTVKWADGTAISLTATASKADKIGFDVISDTVIEATIISQNH